MTNNKMPGEYVPKCGSSDKRNDEYFQNFSEENYYRLLVPEAAPLILDVGAHRGESIRFFKAIFPDAQMYSFEPEPVNFAVLQQVAAEYSNVTAINQAVSDRAATLDFYKQSISHLGSLIKINNDSRDSLGYARSAANEVCRVDAVTLNEFIAGLERPVIDLVKIDVQGYEGAVLEGARRILNRVRCVIVEISLYDFYSNDSDSLLAVHTTLAAAGFKLFDLPKVSKNPKNYRTDWIEAVYVSSEHSLLND